MSRERHAWCIPSRITTHDAEYLPVYAEEPGEQELVVLQCPVYMDDMQIPHPQQSSYSPMPDFAPNSSVLEDGPHLPAGGSSTNLPTAFHRHSGSTGPGNGLDNAPSSSFLPPANRGEALPYFEVILDANHSAASGPHSASTSGRPGAASSHPPPGPSGPQKRTTSLRSILNRISNSTASYASSAASLFRPASHPSNSPRPKITPPSAMIALSSISAPLTYTTVRTMFIPPKGGGGLTADQVRRIYSRDSFGRFGVPYGPDAVAFALWLSRNDLVFGGVPPGFEETVGSGSSDGTALRPAAADGH